MKHIAILITLIAFAATAQAAPETYILDNHHTVANFSVTCLGVANKTYKFDKTSGIVVFDRAAKTGSAEVTIDAASINTGMALLNRRIQSADLLDTAQYPVIRFQSHTMTLHGNRMRLAGDLTIKGITKWVTLTVTHFKCAPYSALQPDTCVAHATTTIKRSDFHMGKYALLAGNDVTLSLALKAVQEEQPVVDLANRGPTTLATTETWHVHALSGP